MIKIFDQNMKEIEIDKAEYQYKLFPLDNFSSFGLMMDGKYFQTSEHAFQYLKFCNTNTVIATIIKESFSPNDARAIAIDNKIYRRPDWNSVKYKNMEKVIRLKVDLNPTVRQALLDTKDYIIAECCIDEDRDWGIDNNNEGENHLGKILMKIRDDIRKDN